MSRRSLPPGSQPCLGCHRPSMTLYCDSCAPPPREVALRTFPVTSPQRRWNGEALPHADTSARHEPEGHPRLSAQAVARHFSLEP